MRTKCHIRSFYLDISSIVQKSIFSVTLCSKELLFYSLEIKYFYYVFKRWWIMDSLSFGLLSDFLRLQCALSSSNHSTASIIISKKKWLDKFTETFCSELQFKISSFKAYLPIYRSCLFTILILSKQTL